MVLYVAFAALPVPAQDLRMSAGIEIGYLPVNLEGQVMFDAAGTVFTPGTPFREEFSYQAIVIRAFCDFSYGLVSLGYRTTPIPRVSTEVKTPEGQSTTDNDFAIGLLELRVLAEYPFEIGPLKICPMLGLEYLFCLFGRAFSSSFANQDRKDYTDVSLIGGISADVRIASRVYLRPSFIAGYNLSSRRSQGFYSGVSYVKSWGREWEISLGLGYML
jgi:hypothetical protein